MRSDTATVSELLSRLRRVGQKPPRWLVDAILRHGHEAVAPLIQIVNEYPVDDPDAPHERYYAAHHAIRLLGDLRAAEAVDPIMGLLEEDDDFIEECLPESLGKIGAPAFEPLREALIDPDVDLYGAARAANALVKLAEEYPDYRSQIVSLLLERFEADIPSDEPEALRGFLASDLADLRAVEAIPAVRRAYGLNRVDETIISLDHFRSIVERPEGVATHAVPLLSNIGSESTFLDGLVPGPDLPLDDAVAGTNRMPVLARKVGRNESCPCGSGTKYKRCHGR